MILSILIKNNNELSNIFKIFYVFKINFLIDKNLLKNFIVNYSEFLLNMDKTIYLIFFNYLLNNINNFLINIFFTRNFIITIPLKIISNNLL